MFCTAKLLDPGQGLDCYALILMGRRGVKKRTLIRRLVNLIILWYGD